MRSEIEIYARSALVNWMYGSSPVVDCNVCVDFIFAMCREVKICVVARVICRQVKICVVARVMRVVRERETGRTK